ncbi:hypothetical protein M8A51_18810 [Schlegelella sp. S2-27]|uniref:YjbR protein n=1 Tax=Caldimonas mangrovi TaxID=2944811 RepID=A0ABT0YS69_9BURK|nr:hypothetical protein [Caldimonas mangrovi]MCM5681581.1 hypothetical protein [Caldimonas mangrovi]
MSLEKIWSRICSAAAAPVNYESMHVSAGRIEYVAAGQRHLVRLNDVARLEFVREEALFPDLDGPYIESKWRVHPCSGTSIEIMDEWPHRRQLLQAFKAHLPGFDQDAARQGLQAKGEGRWLCWQARR